MLELDPRRVFNSDETPIPMNPKPKAVITQKGAKNVYKKTGNNDKENVLVLITSNAASEIAPPFLLFSGKQLPKEVAQLGPRHYRYGVSESGWMTLKAF